MYNHGEIDKKWQDRWHESGVFKAEDFSDKPKKYLLIEFPFPSGAGLHVGHPRSYVALDTLARKYRMQGNNVLYPIGWDAFGLPTENYAIKTGRPPAEVTEENIATFKRQIQSLGLSFDWSREVDSTDPGYYKWTQWQFLQFFKAGLAYKAKTMINWCPKCKIGLANEEAQGGVCERCGGPVEKREKEQWMIGITKYADRLLSDLNTVDYLPRIRKQQEEWIGKSEGAEIEFKIEGSEKSMRVFTTRPDTLFGVTYVTLAPEHSLVAEITNAEQRAAVSEYVAAVARKTEMERTDATREKTGVFTGAYAVNPANNEHVPVWISDYVLAGYGTGAVMAVPAHDERDWEFAKKFGLPIKIVVAEQFDARINDAKQRNTVRGICIRDGKLLLEYDKIMGEYILPGGGIETGENPEEALFREIREETGYLNAKIIKSLGVTENNYFHPKKESGFQSTDFGFVFELSNEEVEERSDVEVQKIDVCWFPIADALEKIKKSSTFKHGALFVERAVSGRDALYCEEGIAVNSGFLNGLRTEESQQKMIAWLEENKAGARKMTYKLRDWVFSRQRYWGEPIPLVHCEHCAEEKLQYVFIHGFKGSVGTDFFPWLKKEFAERGHSVVALDLPHADEPDVEEQVQFLLDNVTFTSNTVIIAHSLGTVVAQKLLPKLSVRVRKTIFVDGFMEPKFVDHPRPQVEQAIDWVFDAEKVNAATEELVLLADETESVFSLEQHRKMAQFYHSVIQVVKPGEEHFCADREPVILELATITGWNALPDSELPLTLPEVAKYEPTDSGESPLASIPEFVNAKCPRCGGDAKRETDTMPNWAGSSWYFLRYIDAHNDQEFAAADKLKYWMPIDLYNGGMEHTTLHLLYSRFWNKFMYDCGYVPTAEPYARRVSHGLIMAEDGTKMSKSKGNVVNPDEIIQAQGADTLRLYEMFIGPFSEPAPWSTNGVSGVKRFLDRVMRLSGLVKEKESDAVTRGLHKMLKAVTEDYDRMSFNTVVAHHMTFVNTIYGEGAITKESLKLFLRALNVAAPHVSEELWEQIGGTGLVCQESWPQFDHSLTIDETFELVVQINGKVRDRIVAASSATEDEMKSLALQSVKVSEILNGKEPNKVIVIPGKLVNIVV